MVKDKNQTINDQVEVIDCRFEHPDGSKGGTNKKNYEKKLVICDSKINQNRLVMEEKIGFIDIEVIQSIQSVKRRSQETNLRTSLKRNENNVNDRSKRPARLLPLRMIL